MHALKGSRSLFVFSGLPCFAIMICKKGKEKGKTVHCLLRGGECAVQEKGKRIISNPMLMPSYLAPFVIPFLAMSSRIPSYPDLSSLAGSVSRSVG